MVGSTIARGKSMLVNSTRQQSIRCMTTTFPEHEEPVENWASCQSIISSSGSLQWKKKH